MKRIRRATPYQKEQMVLSALSALSGKKERAYGEVYWSSAQEIAEQIGYRSANSIRRILKELEYDNMIKSMEYSTVRGCVNPAKLYMSNEHYARSVWSK